MKISRFYQNLEEYLKPGKALIIYGSRQVGKTTLLKDFLSRSELKYRLDSGENISVQEVFASNDFAKILEYAKYYELIAIDEAQKIKNIGQGLKIIVDQIPTVKIITTGSSSFELAGQIGEPLTGRKNTIVLFPVAQIELKKIYNDFDLKRKLEEFLIFGCYPEVAAAENASEKKKIITEIANSYLLKDILALDKIRNSKVILDLLRLLAFQVGNEVSFSELAKQLGIDYKTVARYLDILEKSFVLYNLRGFSRNLRKEITKKSKYYFYDTGVRNAIISNFNSLELRDDIGKLWENFIVMERLKKQAYTAVYANNYFWRTWDGKEIDWLEERGGKLYGYELKWRDGDRRAPKDWIENYPNSSFEIINKDNYLEFIA